MAIKGYCKKHDFLNCPECEEERLATALREQREGIITKIKERLAHCRKTGAEHAEPGLYAALGIVRSYDGGGEEEDTP